MNAQSILALAVAAVVILSGCRREDERDFTVEIPQAGQADVAVIVQAISQYHGIDPKSVTFDAATHKLSLRYDSMQLAKKNIEISIAQAGFTANGVTPESVGAKPKR